MAALLLLADLLRIHTNVAAALAIEISIVSNFLFNDRWTFADRAATARGWWTRAFRFHAVSGVGAMVQWTTFVLANYALASALSLVSAGRFVEAFSRPPAVGAWKYLSQFVGIGLAAVWNFIANLNWTWRGADPRGKAE